jgi:hypothetical protein
MVKNSFIKNLPFFRGITAGFCENTRKSGKIKIRA